MNRSDYEEAERLGEARAQQWPAIAVIFLTQQATFFSVDYTEPLRRNVEWVKTGAWLMLTAVLLAAIWNGGYWFKRREVRALLNDEVTRANRADALAKGFMLAMLVALALYVVNLFDPIGTRIVLHLVVSTGIAAAVLRFAILERRAYRG